MRLWPFTKKTLAPVASSRGWFPLISEPYSGAWQRDDEWTTDTVLANHAVYACITLIQSDIGKLAMNLVRKDSQGIWSKTESPAFSPLLRRPNRYQNRIQFKEWWITSKLLRGNAYALKQRDDRNVVTALYLLDANRVEVLVSDDGSVFYQLNADNISGLREPLTVPASEIIHDRMNCLFHPLIGTSPIYASGASANQSLEIQKNQHKFFSNGSKPGGVLTAPGAISKETADRLQTHWNENYTGENAGRVAVVGDGLKFEPMRMNAVDSQLIEQLQWDAKVVCSTFHVPPYMIGITDPPNYNNIEALAQQYYAQCLQSLIESFELCMTEGLSLPPEYGVELDLQGLLRMDTATQYDTLGKGIGAGMLAPNEARKRINLPPVDGGQTPYLQQQNYSLSALDKRDSMPLPASQPTPDEVVADALKYVKKHFMEQADE